MTRLTLADRAAHYLGDMRLREYDSTLARQWLALAVSLALLGGCADSTYESDTGLATAGSAAPSTGSNGGGGPPGFIGASGIAGTDDQVVATASTEAATAVVGGAETVTITFASNDGLSMSGFGVSGSLATLPPGWIGPKTFTCASLSTGSGCVLNLTYAPAAVDAGMLTVDYVVIDNARTPRTTGSLTIAYSATQYGNVMAVVSPTGQINAAAGGSEAVDVAFVTDDGNAATGFSVTTDLSMLPPGWTNAAGGLACSIVSTGNGCALLLKYAPSAAAAGTLTLDYAYTDAKGAAKTGTLGIPYFTTAANNVVAEAMPGGQIVAVQKTGGQAVPVTFTTDDGKPASQLYVTTDLNSLPAGWKSAVKSFACGSVSTGSGCQLPLTYAPTALASGTLPLSYAYTDGAGAAHTGLLDIAYAATTNDNVVGTPSPTGQINAVVGMGTQPLLVTFTTDDAQPATALQIKTLATLPAGWTSAETSFACPGINIDTTCQLPLSYAPAAAGSGTLALGYTYVNDAGQPKTGTVNVAYRATTDDNVVGTASPTSFIVRSGSSNTAIVTFVTDDGNPASVLAVSGLATLPAGWTTNASNFACATVSAGTTCSLALHYAPAPASSDSGTLTLQYTYNNDAGFAKTGTVAIPYAAITPYLYVANNGANDFSSCPLNFDDSIGACTVTAGGLNGPAGLAFNNSSAYVANTSGGTVSRCDIDAGGIITSCAATGGTFTSPTYLAINAAGTFAYVEQSSSTSMCSVVPSDGSLANCTATALAFQPLNGIALTPDGALAYSVQSPTVVEVCNIAIDGTWSACTNSGAPLAQAQATLAVHAGNLYVATSAGLAVCPVKGDGTIVACQIMPGTSTAALAFHGSTVYASSGSGSITACTVNADGTFASCTAVTDSTYSGTAGLAIR